MRDHDPYTADMGETMEKRHPIQVVSRRSGLSQDVLRAWERRYGVVEPGRSDGGQRLYSDRDIEHLRLLRIAVAGGRRISDIAELSDAELKKLTLDDHALAGSPDLARVDPVAMMQCLEAIRRLDSAELEQILHRELYIHGNQNFIEGLVAPLMVEVGRLWHEGKLGSGNEHLATEVLRGLVARVLADARPANPHGTVVVGTTAGQRHEVGGLLAAAIATQENWRVIYLGADLPASELTSACSELDADLLVLSFAVRSESADDLAEFAAVMKSIPASVSVLAGGDAAMGSREALYDLGVTVLDSLSDFRLALADRVPPD